MSTGHETSNGWDILRAKTVAGHSIYLVHVVAEDGSEIHEIIVDCVLQSCGALSECESTWRTWIRHLNKIESNRQSGKTRIPTL